MKTSITFTLRAFPVIVENTETKELNAALLKNERRRRKG